MAKLSEVKLVIVEPFVVPERTISYDGDDGPVTLPEHLSTAVDATLDDQVYSVALDLGIDLQRHPQLLEMHIKSMITNLGYQFVVLGLVEDRYSDVAVWVSRIMNDRAQRSRQ